MPELETLEPSASDVSEQPETAQAETEQLEVAVTEAPESGEPETETAPPEPQLLAGKYKTAQELEEGYRNAQAENSRMAQELAQYRRQTQNPQTTSQEKPKYTQDQLETWKESRLVEMSRYSNLAERLQAEGKYHEAQQAMAQAGEAARQVRLIDKELRSLDIAAYTQQSTRQSAESRLVADASNVVKAYSADLVPGTDLYNKASYFLEGFAAMGQDPQNTLVQAQAVLMAASVLGLPAKRVEQDTRKELTKTINTALKTGIKAGAGKASKAASLPDFSKMKDEDFIKWKAERGLG